MKATTRFGGVVALAAVTAMGLTACDSKDSGGGGGESSAAPSSETAALDENGVDRQALDTGSYPTEPRPPFGEAETEFILDYEGQRLAEYVLAPSEVDPTLTKPVGMANVLRSSGALNNFMTAGSGDVAKKNNFQYGYDVGAIRPQDDVNAPRHELDNSVLRFMNPESANAAAREFYELALTEEGTAPADLRWGQAAGATTPLATIRTQELSGHKTVTVQTFVPQEKYLLHTYVTAPVADEQWAKDVSTRAVEMGLPLMAKFPGRPTKADVEAGAPKPPPAKVDEDEILIYTIPERDNESGFGDDQAVYGPRGMSHRSTNPPLDLRLLTEVGAEHTAVAGSTAYRARDEAGAERIVTEFLNDARTQGREDAPSPKGLPNAKCMTDYERGSRHDMCLIRVGRYVGEVHSSKVELEAAASATSAPSATSSSAPGGAGGPAPADGDPDATVKRDVDQKASAQYLILTKADQNRRP